MSFWSLGVRLCPSLTFHILLWVNFAGMISVQSSTKILFFMFCFVLFGFLSIKNQSLIQLAPLSWLLIWMSIQWTVSRWSLGGLLQKDCMSMIGKQDCLLFTDNSCTCINIGPFNVLLTARIIWIFEGMIRWTFDKLLIFWHQILLGDKSKVDSGSALLVFYQ